MELDDLISDVRGQLDAQLKVAEAAVQADAVKQVTRVARDSFKAVVNDYRRAIANLDEVSAALLRAKRNLAHTQVEHITDADEREAALKKILGE